MMKLEPYNQREIYVARYGKDLWAQAVKLASSHRLRAAKDYGLSKHWSAAEWLDLCAPWDFRCPSCRAEGHLTPHHRHPLGGGGDNTIANILPICPECHWWMHELGVRCQPSWLPEQLALREQFKVGDLVDVPPRLHRRRLEGDVVDTGRPPHYVITEVVPPTRWPSLSELRSDHDRHRRCRFLNKYRDGASVTEGALTFWRRAMARVGPGEDLVELQSLERVDIMPRLEVLSRQYVEEQRLAREFAVGDGVLFGAAKRPHYGVILEIVYPALGSHELPLVPFGDIQLARWPTVTPATAILKNLDRRGVPAVRPSYRPLSALAKTNTTPHLDERWHDIWEAMTTSPMSRSLRRRLKAVLSKPTTG